MLFTQQQQHRKHAVLIIALLLIQGVLFVCAHEHAGCGHSLVAGEARRWSELHRQQRQLLEARSEAAAPHASDAAAGGQPGKPRRLNQAATAAAADATVPIRIWVEYQGTQALAAEDRSHLYDTVNIAMGVLQKFYKVRRPAPGKLRVRPFCRMWDSGNYCNAHQPDFLAGGSDNTCGSAYINSSHIGAYTQCSLGGANCREFPGGAGEYTDYYLYITANQDEHCQSGAVAWALPCLYDDTTNRPLLGAANICPEALLNNDQESGVAVLLHELTHALGFTDDMFDKFIAADGTPIAKRDVVQEFVDPSGTTTAMIITPTVVAETKAQFGCDTVPGAALENEGGQGSANAHWEYRWFQSELMVATNLFAVYGKPATLSRITLAFMQDTGWYDVDMDAAGFLNWGYKAGCDFLDSTCETYVAKYPEQQYYCSKAEAANTVNTVCTFDGLARARCTNAQFADGCVMKMALGDPPRPNCLSAKYAAAAGDKFGWSNGLDSRCMPVTWLFNTYTYQFPDSSYKAGWRDSMCYKSSCTAAGALELNILGNKVACPSGQTVDLAKALPQQFQAGLIGPCPDNAAVCGGLSCGDSCTAGGTCVAGNCHCNLMFTGQDCSKKLTPHGNYTNYVPVADDGKASASQTYDAGYLMMSARITNNQEQLYLSLDRYRTAVAQLAGVTTSRVAVLSFLTDAPATSLVGHHHRRLAAAAAGDDSSAAAAAAAAAAADNSDAHLTWVPLAQEEEDDQGSSSSSSSLLLARQQRQQERRRLLQSGQLEVYSRVATLNQADAELIIGRINNATRQEAFSQQLGEAGLKLVPGSVSVKNTDGGGGGGGGGGGTWGLPGLSMSDPNTRRIIIIVACSVGAALLAMALGWAVSCCLRRRRGGAAQRQQQLQQQFIMRAAGGAPSGAPGSYYYGAAAGPGAAAAARAGSNSRTSSVRALFGAPPAAAGAAGGRQSGSPLTVAGGRPVNPFAGTGLQFGGGAASPTGVGGRGRSGVYAAPPPAATGYGPPAAASGASSAGLPVGGYVVAGRTFRTAQEAEEYQLALALQRSLQQTGPPGHYLPRSGGSGQQQQLPPWQQQQQQQSRPYNPYGL